jgi:hypothetical protein
MKINQVYIPYWEWEDFINGMWAKGDESRLQEAINFTGDHLKYGKAMKEVIEAWPRTMLNSLTNTSFNKRAFLGHCAVCYKLGIQESITRMAWKQLTDQQRYDADKVAQQTIDKWTADYEARNKQIRSDVGTALLF